MGVAAMDWTFSLSLSLTHTISERMWLNSVLDFDIIALLLRFHTDVHTKIPPEDRV